MGNFSPSGSICLVNERPPEAQSGARLQMGLTVKNTEIPSIATILLKAGENAVYTLEPGHFDNM